MKRYKFSKELDAEFSKVLKSRVNSYFSTNNIKRQANASMYIKTFIILSIYFVPYFILVLGGISSVPIMFLLWIVMGFGKSFVGTNIMHDGLHGSYSKHKWLNELLGNSSVLLGADPRVWKIQHNVLHHTYTNIEDADDDIQPRYVLRFSPNQPKRWFHQFQFIYALFFYGISTLVWLTFKDFFKSVKYRKLGLMKSGKPFGKHLVMVAVRKILYFIIFLLIPILTVPAPAGIVILGFVTMHMVAGVTLSLIFQAAHVNPEMQFIAQESPQIEQNWLVHQLHTTTNFATYNKVVFWFTGGLNFQIEHHLFPNICHVHYPKLSKIVKATAKEFNLPYYSQKTMIGSIIKHFQMLYLLGKPRTIVGI